MNRLFLLIVFAWFAFAMEACSGNSSTSGESDIESSDDSADPYSGKNSSGEVQRDSLGRPISSAGPNQNGSSSSTGPVIGVEDTLVYDTTTVLDVDALPECTAATEGETFMVQSENKLYFCLDGDWVESQTVSEVVGLTCRDGVLVAGSSAGDDSDDDSNGSSGGNPFGWGNFGGQQQTNSTIDSTTEARIVGARIVGVAEKGPFRYGTSVKLIELDSAQHLADSKRTHKTCILDADGNFNFDSVDLATPYLRVRASGYFRNELTGGLSSSIVSLDAVVDVTEKDSVNVNMLTHMEAPRVLKLVENSGNNQPIRSVKAQALRDILSSFEIQLGESGSSTGGNGGNGFGGWNFGQQQQQQQTTTDGRFAEDIGLFDGDEYSGALLAISIMMQRKGSGSEMLSYTAGIADRIKGNGNWDDNNAKADLADWLMVLDTSGSYATIRNNIASWKMGDVPDFEKHLKRFWTKAYNFGDCNSRNADSVKFISNSLSAFFVSGYDQPGPTVRFICDAETHEWRAATDLEKDTYGYGKGEYEGQLKSGVINKDKYYIYDNDSWRAATSDDIREFEDIEDVYKGLKSGEKVIFFLRHAKRTDDTGKNGHLTDDGKKQSQQVGAKFKGEDIYFANSNYTRSYETCDNIAIGAGLKGAEKNTMDALDGEWYVKDNSKLEQYKSSNGGGWVVASEYAYKGSYPDAFYSLDTYSESFIKEIIKPEFKNVSRVGVFISHDMFVVPLTAYFTDKKVNLRYFDTKQWINYLAGLAIIMGSDGSIRYVPVRGLESGTMTM